MPNSSFNPKNLQDTKYYVTNFNARYSSELLSLAATTSSYIYHFDNNKSHYSRAPFKVIIICNFFS